MAASKITSSVFSVFFEYDTPRIVHIRSKKVGVINRFLQLCIIGYVIGYAIVFKKGYQDFDDVQSAATSKVKGVAMANLPLLGDQVWDVSDYVVPAQENNAFFVVTNLIVTPSQTRGICLEDPKVKDGLCTDDASHCVPNNPVISGNGIMTGNCNESDHDPAVKVCEIHAWCEVEDGNRTAPNPAVLRASKDFTVFIKNNIEFPKFNIKRRNILPRYYNNDTELSNCRFDPDDATKRFCPIFDLQKIVNLTESSSFDDVAISGGVIQIVITWDCNLDLGENECVPKYSFRRLDNPAYKISKGYNFRYSHYSKFENGTETRTLFKAYGIKFILTVQGQAGKFSLVPLLLNIGSGLALLGVATILCDIVVLYVLKARRVYKEKKYLDVKGDDAYEGLQEET